MVYGFGSMIVQTVVYAVATEVVNVMMRDQLRENRFKYQKNRPYPQRYYKQQIFQSARRETIPPWTVKTQPTERLFISERQKKIRERIEREYYGK